MSLLNRNYDRFYHSSKIYYHFNVMRYFPLQKTPSYVRIDTVILIKMKKICNTLQNFIEHYKINKTYSVLYFSMIIKFIYWGHRPLIKLKKTI